METVQTETTEASTTTEPTRTFAQANELLSPVIQLTANRRGKTTLTESNG